MRPTQFSNSCFLRMVWLMGQGILAHMKPRPGEGAGGLDGEHRRGDVTPLGRHWPPARLSGEMRQVGLANVCLWQIVLQKSVEDRRRA
jgi:hypothetical protein